MKPFGAMPLLHLRDQLLGSAGRGQRSVGNCHWHAASTLQSRLVQRAALHVAVSDHNLHRCKTAAPVNYLQFRRAHEPNMLGVVWCSCSILKVIIMKYGIIMGEYDLLHLLASF